MAKYAELEASVSVSVSGMIAGNEQKKEKQEKGLIDSQKEGESYEQKSY